MKNLTQNKNSLTLIGILGLVYLALLLFLKYDLNDIPLRAIRLDYIGNIINISVALILLTGSIVISYSKQQVDKKKKYFLISLSILSIITLGLVWLIARVNFLQTDKLIFNFPIKKVYMGFFFSVGYFLQLYSLIYIWSLTFGKESLLELRNLIRTVLAIILLMFFSLVIVWNVSAYSESKIEGRKFHYGLIPGAAVYSKGKPSPIFEARIRKTLELYRKKVISEIILTGGKAPGEASESEVARNYLVNLGVNKKKITFENKTSTTAEQISYVHMNFFNSNLNDSILVISDGFHLTRTIQIAKFYKVNVFGVASDYSLSFEKTIFYRTRESIALLMFWLFAI